MDERELFEAHFGIPIDQRRTPSKGSYALREHQMMWAGWQAARRTTPDREAIRDAAFEQCAQLVDRMAKQKHDRGADDALVRSIAARIRALKTAPTSDKGGA